MDDRSSTSKPAASSPSQSNTPDIKSPTTRPTYSSKLGDQKSRASEASASNSTARQPPVQQRAWTSNKNPITGRSQTPQGGFNSQNKQSVTGSLREGQRVRVTLASGAEFEGIYNNGADPTTFRLSMVQHKKLPNSADIANGANRREQSTMSFQRKEVTEARTLSGNVGKGDGKVPNGNRSTFRTDTAISNNRLGNERELKRWVPDSNDDVDSGLEMSSSSAPWDQFEVNQRLFGVKTDYDENIYTTQIDKTRPDYREKLAAADRKAREIERSAPVTAHVAEERVMDFVGGEDNGDEEEKYSGVRRQDFPPLSNRDNKYTPPARRAPTGQATVKGAPVDPAIISSQLKAVPTSKPQAPARADETKTATQASKPAVVAAPETKSVDAKPATKANEAKEAASSDEKVDAKATDAKVAEKAAAVARPSATTSRTVTPKEAVAAPSATSTVERDVLSSFKSFATQQRLVAEKHRAGKARADKEVKLTELKNFANSFKLSTPVPRDLISIIAKDPAKQKAIQEKALQDAEEIARQKLLEAAQKEKEKEAAAAKQSQAKLAVEQPATSTTTAPPDSRSSSRPSASQHVNSPSGMPNRHPGPRASYNAQPHYQQYNRNGRTSHMPPPAQPTGNLAQRIRNNMDQQQKLQHPHMGQHNAVQDMRLPPTGPANNADPGFGRRVSAIPPTFMGNKLNPNSHEFRPNAFAPAFLPAGPSQGSSPRSSVNNIVEITLPPTPVQGQLLRRKTKDVDVKKCLILSHILTIQPPAPGKFDRNDGLQPSWDTLPTWRQLQEEAEKPDSTMLLTYKEYFERLPTSGPAAATPNPSHAMPQLPHQHQLPFHLQHGAQNMAPRQSPHLPTMPMHAPQHGHAPHAPFNNNHDDHRMMHSNSAQSFASPRMGQAPMVYPPMMNTPGQIPYGQPVAQPYMNTAAPPLGQFRSFSNNAQFMPPQQPHHMGSPMMGQQFIPGPNGMVAAGPPISMYPAHSQFMPPNAGPPQPMAGSNGFPSPSRPAAPMMVHQGSHQGQPAVYGMSPGMPYQQPVYPPQQPQGKFSGQRPQ